MNLQNQLFSLLNVAAQQQAESNLDAVPVPRMAARSLADGTLTWGEALQFLGVGLVIVFTTLIGLWLVCELMGLAFKRLDRRKGPPPSGISALADTSAKPPPVDPEGARCAALPSAVTGEAPPTAITAAITAAVAAALDSAPHRIVSIQEVAPATDVPLAVFAAAAAVLLGEKPHRILSVRPVDMAWAREGRRAQLDSPSPLRR